MPISKRNRIAVAAFWIIIAFAGATVQSAKLSPSLEGRLASSDNSDSLISVIIFLDNAASQAEIKKVSSSKSLAAEARHRQVIELLKSSNDLPFKQIEEIIIRNYPQAKFEEFWAASAIAVKMPQSCLRAISQISGIYSILENAPLELIAPVESAPAALKMSTVSNHLAALNIPALWKRGLKGKGRLVCNFDTGVEQSHPALSEKWRGNHADKSACWFAPNLPDTTPVDNVGHGTHTMGIMVGNAAEDSFGVAPAAQWITAAVIDQGQTLSRTISDILAAFQWAIDPDGDPTTTDDCPDVILNSWGIPATILPPCDETFSQVIENVEAAGVVTIFAAGNEGPEPMTLRLPAVQASTPLNAFAVGAIDDATNLIASFSSRGPSNCDATALKPEVVAPGISITSSYKGGTYRVMSGTSMAAPFIAGMVALLRQYNPEATVDEIKTALILSARDLGTAGEDNDYGHGLPDAGKALQYLPAPAQPEVYLDAFVIGGDGIADPGETIDLFVRLNLPAMSVDSLSCDLIALDSGAEILTNHVNFVFENGLAFSMNILPFAVRLNPSLINGQALSFNIIAAFPYEMGRDTLDFSLIVGRAPNGRMITHETPELKMTVSDFGQFGMGANSIYPAGGDGFQFDGSGNILYEAGIIIGRNALQLSSSVRDSLGRADHSDFSPILPLATSLLDNHGGLKSYAEFTDAKSILPIPVKICQTVLSYERDEESNYLIIKYSLVNEAVENLSGLYFGFLADFDIDPAGDFAQTALEGKLYCQIGNGYKVGILPLDEARGIIAINNGNQKKALTGGEKFDYIRTDGIVINDSLPCDHMTVHAFGPFNIAPHDSSTINLAIIADRDLGGLIATASNVLSKYLGTTDIEEGDEEEQILPSEFELYQNYPNPFNPTTTIMFVSPRAEKVKISIYNILGQEICVLYDGMARIGNNTVIWDGRDSRGSAVGTGIYLYRLESASGTISKKALMIK
jgi:subtilisin family serine protease